MQVNGLQRQEKQWKQRTAVERKAKEETDCREHVNITWVYAIRFFSLRWFYSFSDFELI